MDHLQVAPLCELYHKMGLKHHEILQCLSDDGIQVSIRTLRRILCKAGLYRRKYHSSVLDVALYILGETHGSGQLHGYRLMHMKCIQAGFVVSQETVRLMLHLLDPNGVRMRRTNRLHRRIYENPGPDFMWHVDSYDKLKPYGVCINGAIDGFSRYIIWLQAYTTNSNPAIIASYFMDAVKLRMACPKRIRADLGNENGHIMNMQTFLRYDHNDDFATNCFLYGSSNHNQRIEAWWGFMRKQCVQYWMNIFVDLKNADLFTGDFLDKNLIQFCFVAVIQGELDALSSLWNTHHIRRSRDQISPSGRPSMMYTVPQFYGFESHACPVNPMKVRVCETECLHAGPYPCDETVFELCCLNMAENNLDKPSNADEAVQLYRLLRYNIRYNLARL